MSTGMFHPFAEDATGVTCKVCGDWPDAAAHLGHSKPPVTRTIIAIKPSAILNTAVVIVTSVCHHRHVRAYDVGFKVGDNFDCTFCAL